MAIRSSLLNRTWKLILSDKEREGEQERKRCQALQYDDDISSISDLEDSLRAIGCPNEMVAIDLEDKLMFIDPSWFCRLREYLEESSVVIMGSKRTQGVVEVAYQMAA